MCSVSVGSASVAAEDKRVSFARINRRDEQLAFQERSFTDEMIAMAQHGELTAERTYLGQERIWTAGDLEIVENGTFMTGLMGFMLSESQFIYDQDAKSWAKGRRQGDIAASERTVVPFAVDLRPERRWVAFGTTQRIRRRGFAEAFQQALNTAVALLGLIPTVWEVDLVTSQSTIEGWLREHPDVVILKRTIKLPNPVRDLTGVLEEIATVNARTKAEEFRAAAGQSLNLLASGSTLATLLQGVEQGHTAVDLVARGEGRGRPRFSTAVSSDEGFVQDWGDDVELGKLRVLQALTVYSSVRAGEVGDLGEEEVRIIIENEEMEEPGA